MSKQLVLCKIDHIENELRQLREMVRSMVENEVTTNLFEPQGLSEFYAIAYQMYGVTKDQILGKSRKTKIIIIRQIVCYFLNVIRGYSLNDIAILTGYKEHSAVLHSCRKVKDGLEIQDEKFMTYYNNFKHLMR